MKILLVDDMTDILDALADEISSIAGVEVIKATSGNEAIRKIDQNIDLIITDDRMPDGTGKNVFDYLSQNQIAIPTILHTATKPEWRPEAYDNCIVVAEKLDLRPLIELVRKISSKSEN